MNHLTDVTQVRDVENDDLRLKPKDRKHPELWQYYLMTQELVEMQKRHNLRISSASAGKSNLSVEVEQYFIDYFQLEAHTKPKNKKQKEYSIFWRMVEAGQAVGPIWDWLLDHKGIGHSLAAKILALIDDIEKFDTVAKLWRYAGYGINEYWCDDKGKAICPKEGWKWTGAKDKRYRVWTVVSNDYVSDVTQQDNVNSNSSNSQELHVTQYIDAMPQDKQWAIPQNYTLPPLKRVDFLEPEPGWQLKKMSDRLCKGYHAPYCTPLKSTLFLVAEQFNKANTPFYKDMYLYEKERYLATRDITKGYAHNMAWRKVKKEFLKQLWLKWREYEGLPITEEWK